MILHLHLILAFMSQSPHKNQAINHRMHRFITNVQFGCNICCDSSSPAVIDHHFNLHESVIRYLSPWRLSKTYLVIFKPYGPLIHFLLVSHNCNHTELIFVNEFQQLLHLPTNISQQPAHICCTRQDIWHLNMWTIGVMSGESELCSYAMVPCIVQQQGHWFNKILRSCLHLLICSCNFS